MLKQIETFNKAHIENNTASNTSKKAHKKLFKNMPKEIKTVNQVHKQDIIFDYDKCKKLHKELFNKVLIELLSNKNAGHKDSSANINEACAHDTKCETDNANSLLHNHILYYFNKIKKIEKALSDHSKYILTSLNKKFSDNTVKLSEFKKVNDKLNLLNKGVCLFMFNKNIKKESILENVNMLYNITEHTAFIDNKRVWLGDIHEYLYENINYIHDNIKNKKYEKVLAGLLLIQKHTFKSINRMRIHNVNKKIACDNKANKKITNANSANKKINSANKVNKKSNKANEKITSANSANKKITSANIANKKITSVNSANEKVNSANSANEKVTSANSANEKITSANDANGKSNNGKNANEKSTNGNNANANSTNTMRKKSLITIKLKKPLVIY